MIKIIAPNNNLNERKYIVDIIFNEFLGVEYALEVGTENYEITLKNDNKLVFEDGFFNQYHQDLSYLKLENIPAKAKCVKNKFTEEGDIPVIYGNSTLDVKDKNIFCGIDVFASCFFMLTRWEEYVNKNRDAHNRFPATESIAYKNNFLDRPVVNEYVEMLKNMLSYLDNNLQFKTEKSQLYLTHDVDELYMWKSWRQVFRIGIADILKRRNLSLAVERFSEYFLIKKDKIKDSFDTFDWLMEQSETIGVKSRFYFMSGGITKYDNKYKINEPKCLALINKIKKREHIIGFHPSYNAYDNGDQFKKEKKLLEKTVGQKITEGRQHYLRFEVPTTWQVWEDNGMKVDSTCGYADKEGFRCGTGNEFSVFNILTRKQLKLKELPLIVMECSLAYYQNITPDEMEKRIKHLMDRVKKYNGKFVFLWHNSSFNTSEWRKYNSVYKRSLDNMKKKLETVLKPA